MYVNVVIRQKLYQVRADKVLLSVSVIATAAFIGDQQNFDRVWTVTSITHDNDWSIK